MKRLISTLILLFWLASLSFSQNILQAIVTDVHISLDSSKIKVLYQLDDIGKHDVYKVNAEFYRSKNKMLNTKTFSGDINQKLQTGPGKRSFVWDIHHDSVAIQDHIFAKVYATKYVPVQTGWVVIKSLVFPGFGDYSVRNGKSYYLYGLLSYGCLAASILYINESNNTYSKYKATQDVNETDDLFDKAVQQRYISYIFMGAAATVCLADITGVLLKIKKIKRNSVSYNGTYYFEKTNNKYFGKSNFMHIDSRGPFDLAKEKGDSLYDEKKYAQARTYYEKALSLNSNVPALRKKMNKTDSILNVYRIKDLKNDKEVARADSFFNSRDYLNAKVIYQSCLNYKKSDHVTQKIKDIDSIIYAIEADKKYKRYISKGDSFQKIKEYDSALSYFESACFVKPSETYALSRKAELAKIVYKINDESYAKNIIVADNAFLIKEYLKAKEYYLKAKSNKPTEPYPQLKLNEINILLKGMTSYDLPVLFKACKKAVFLVFTSADNYKHTTIQGSGFFITESGIGVSNYHVFEKASISSVIIKTEDEEYDVDEILEKNKESDYIIFRVTNNRNTKFDYVRVANEELEVGEKVFAIGNPKGLEKTLSEGIVSGYREERKYIQTTCQMTHGSSGGPLFNRLGEVIGITSSGMGEADLNFAVNILLLQLSKYTK
jgi:serine protease Do